MLVCKKLLLPFAFACCGSLFAQNIQNPVLPGVVDAGVMKYNGKYYIGGVRTNGDFYVSDDLVHWGKPIHVVTMDNDWTRGSGAGDDQIHANDMFYLNGDFHLYWSVNYWGKDSMPFTLYMRRAKMSWALIQNRTRRHGWITVSTPKYSEMMMDNYTCIWYVLLMEIPYGDVK